MHKMERQQMMSGKSLGEYMSVKCGKTAEETTLMLNRWYDLGYELVCNYATYYFILRRRK